MMVVWWDVAWSDLLPKQATKPEAVTLMHSKEHFEVDMLNYRYHLREFWGESSVAVLSS